MSLRCYQGLASGNRTAWTQMDVWRMDWDFRDNIREEEGVCVHLQRKSVCLPQQLTEETGNFPPAGQKQRVHSSLAWKKWKIGNHLRCSLTLTLWTPERQHKTSSVTHTWTQSVCLSPGCCKQGHTETDSTRPDHMQTISAWLVLLRWWQGGGSRSDLPHNTSCKHGASGGIPLSLWLWARSQHQVPLPLPDLWRHAAQLAGCQNQRYHKEERERLGGGCVCVCVCVGSLDGKNLGEHKL